jgi:hypothetical protein
MDEAILPYGRAEPDLDPGCAYIVDEPGLRRVCSAPRQGSSPYCSTHHALCYITCGSTAEAKRLREVEELASRVGGRRARKGAGPSLKFLRRLEQAVRERP